MKQGRLMEIFSSYQGEGVWAGVHQIFVRLGICHMRCSYCDTPDSWTALKTYRVEREPHGRDSDEFANPASVDDVLGHLRRLEGRPYHSISVTGGEPLVQVEFLESLLPKLRELWPVYLETSGTLSDSLARVAPHCDYFALDYKPPSTPGVKSDREDFRRCVEIASRGEAQVKIVLMQESPTDDEVAEACDVVRGIRSDIPLVFTPVTEVNAACRAPDGARIRALRTIAEERGLVPYVIPQIHHLVGWK